MDDFSYPQQSNYFNLPPSPLNYLQPFKQSVTSMTPIIVTDKLGRAKIVIGAAGGVKIISSVLLVNQLNFSTLTTIKKMQNHLGFGENAMARRRYQTSN